MLTTNVTQDTPMNHQSGKEGNYEINSEYMVKRVWFDHQTGMVNVEIDREKTTLAGDVGDFIVAPEVNATTTTNEHMTAVESASNKPLRVAITDELPQIDHQERVGVRVLPHN